MQSTLFLLATPTLQSSCRDLLISKTSSSSGASEKAKAMTLGSPIENGLPYSRAILVTTSYWSGGQTASEILLFPLLPAQLEPSGRIQVPPHPSLPKTFFRGFPIAVQTGNLFVTKDSSDPRSGAGQKYHLWAVGKIHIKVKQCFKMHPQQNTMLDTPIQSILFMRDAIQVLLPSCKFVHGSSPPITLPDSKAVYLCFERLP